MLPDRVSNPGPLDSTGREIDVIPEPAAREAKPMATFLELDSKT